MRIYNISGRACLGTGSGAVDIEIASSGAFSADVQSLYSRWDEFTTWAADFDGASTVAIEESELASPVPLPPQIFAIGLNYRDHAVESGLDIPEIPVVFAKFPASVAGPYDRILLPPGAVDFETELVVVIGKPSQGVRAADAWSHVAGLTVGQDLSERHAQWAGTPPQQFSLAKSFPGFSPIGPVLVTPDEFENPDDLQLGCSINGVEMQKSRTSDMLFTIPEVIEYLSRIVPLLPGDAIFTGTPAGVGFSRDPKVLLGQGDTLATYVEGIGEMRHTFGLQGE